MATLGKPQRQHRILRILESHPVSSQPQLLQLLEADGIVATQATVSRDLEELGAVKVRIPGGAMAYAIPEYIKERAPGGDDHLRRLMGDPDIDFVRAGTGHELWDLGEAWFELTRLPFVYAVWAIRRGAGSPKLCRLLREARDFGMDTLDHIISSRPEYDLDFRKDYLGWHIHYHLGSDERRGIQRFIELLEKHSLGPVHPPRYIS